LALSQNRLKGLNNWLENRVKSMKEELEKCKDDFCTDQSSVINSREDLKH